MGRRPILIPVLVTVFIIGTHVRNAPAEDRTAAARLAADGLKAFEMGQYQEAVKALSMAVKMDPDNPYYSMALGQAYLSAGKPKSAIPLLKWSLAAFPGDFDIRYTLAEAYLNADDFRYDLEALKVLAGKPPPEPMRAPWLFLKGFSLFRLGQYENAEPIFGELLAYKDMEAPAFFFLANCKFGEDRYEEALPLYEKAIRLGSVPDNKALNAYFYNYGLALYRLRKFGKAAEAFRNSIHLYPEDPLPRFFLGRCETELGNIKEAVADYESLIDKFPNFGPAYYQLARLYAKQGDKKRAEELFRKDATIKKNASEEAEQRLASKLKLGR